MRRTADGDGGSLDLLLDTICNAFGGIIFIALLLAVLSQAVGNQRSAKSRQHAVDELTAIEQEQQIRALSSRLLELNARVAGATGQVQVVTLEALQVLRSDRAKLDDQLKQLRSEASLAQQDISSMDDRLRRNQALLASLTTEAQTLDNQAVSAETPEQRVFRLPFLHQVNNKYTVFLIIAGGKLYCIYDPDLLPEQMQFWTHDVDVESAGGVDVVEPRDSGGTAIGPTGPIPAPLQQSLARLNPQFQYFSIAVNPDSFAEFTRIKNAIVAAGFEYIWTPHQGPLRIELMEKVNAL